MNVYRQILLCLRRYLRPQSFFRKCKWYRESQEAVDVERDVGVNSSGLFFVQAHVIRISLTAV